MINPNKLFTTVAVVNDNGRLAGYVIHCLRCGNNQVLLEELLNGLINCEECDGIPTKGITPPRQNPPKKFL